MTQWEYLTLDLSDLPKRTSLVETLNAAGGGGWEMIAITLNNIAILKRKYSAKESSKPVAKASSVQNSRVT